MWSCLHRPRASFDGLLFVVVDATNYELTFACANDTFSESGQAERLHEVYKTSEKPLRPQQGDVCTIFLMFGV